MLTELEKQIIIYAADNSRKSFYAVQFVEANSKFKSEAVYAALDRLDKEGILSSFKIGRPQGSTVPVKRFFKSTKAANHIAKGLKLLKK